MILRISGEKLNKKDYHVVVELECPAYKYVDVTSRIHHNQTTAILQAVEVLIEKHYREHPLCLS